ncbi:MAG: transposase, partial [Proteobacteria bacterium]|nr:transposase [Pseudomonadota bacterium]
FRTLNIKDLFTHEAVAIHVDRSITGEDVAGVIDRIALTRGYPGGIICDNGIEFTSIAMDRWSFRTSVDLKFIQPGKPIQNAFIESFNAIFRNECLNRYWFEDLSEARRIIEAWRKEYNEDRTQKRLGKITPIQFANNSAELLTA